jgi:hypothetical protein
VNVEIRSRTDYNGTETRRHPKRIQARGKCKAAAIDDDANRNIQRLSIDCSHHRSGPQSSTDDLVLSPADHTFEEERDCAGTYRDTNRAGSPRKECKVSALDVEVLDHLAADTSGGTKAAGPHTTRWSLAELQRSRYDGE